MFNTKLMQVPKALLQPGENGHLIQDQNTKPSHLGDSQLTKKSTDNTTAVRSGGGMQEKLMLKNDQSVSVSGRLLHSFFLFFVASSPSTNPKPVSIVPLIAKSTTWNIIFILDHPSFFFLPLLWSYIYNHSLFSFSDSFSVQMDASVREQCQSMLHQILTCLLFLSQPNFTQKHWKIERWSKKQMRKEKIHLSLTQISTKTSTASFLLLK